MSETREFDPATPDEKKNLKKYPAARVIGLLQGYNYAYKKDGKTFVDLEEFVGDIQAELEFELHLTRGKYPYPFTKQPISFTETVIDQLEKAGYLQKGEATHKPKSIEQVHETVAKLSSAIQTANEAYQLLPPEIIQQVNKANPFWEV